MRVFSDQTADYLRSGDLKGMSDALERAVPVLNDLAHSALGLQMEPQGKALMMAVVILQAVRMQPELQEGVRRTLLEWVEQERAEPTEGHA